MSTDILTRHGVLRAQQVVEIAEHAGLNLACAATVLEKESAGGRNVWGSDGVPTGGTYVKGAEVTKAAYLAYKPRRNELGFQGVGPCQLTYYTLQDQADERGGCWDPVVNLRVGFAHLAGLIARYGEREGFRRYNGSGPAAERYADDAMRKLAVWQMRLAGAPSSTGTGGSAVPDSLEEGATGDRVAHLQGWLNRMYPAYSAIDVRPKRYGPQTVAVIREFQRRSGVSGADADGRTIGPRTWAQLLAAGYRPS